MFVILFIENLTNTLHNNIYIHTDDTQNLIRDKPHVARGKCKSGYINDMIASGQSHVTIKYQVFAYNEEVKDGRMIILP